MRILVPIPVRPSLNQQLQVAAFNQAHQMIAANPLHSLTLMFDYRPIPKQESDCRPWSKVTRIRNLVLDTVDLSQFDYLLWIDADVVHYPANMPTQLMEANPNGVSSPLVLIEGTDRFYDWAAFIMKGKDHILPTDRQRICGRNLQHQMPYWNGYPKEPGYKIDDEENAFRDVTFYNPTERVVEMDCVGTITLVPAWVYKHTRYVDHEAFTDHYPICKACRDQGEKVVCVKDVVAYHADLTPGRYAGESWH